MLYRRIELARLGAHRGASRSRGAQPALRDIVGIQPGCTPRSAGARATLRSSIRYTTQIHAFWQVLGIVTQYASILRSNRLAKRWLSQVEAVMDRAGGWLCETPAGGKDFVRLGPVSDTGPVTWLTGWI